VILPVIAAICAAAATSLLGAALAGPGEAGHHAGAATKSDGLPDQRPPLSVKARAVPLAGLGAAAGVVVAGPAGLIGGALVGGTIPYVNERRKVARRVRRIEEQLVDAVTAIASALRSGRSLVQALAIAAEEVGDPLGGILGDACDRSALGVPFDEVLESLAAKIGGTDAKLVTGVLRLHRRTGGTLATSLDDLVRTLRARRDGARELRSLTAQARLSATILGLLPLGFFLFLSVVARRDIEAAYRSSAGVSAIGIGLALQGAAFVWIRRLLRVEDA
jgi:tight adherence protein B